MKMLRKILKWLGLGLLVLAVAAGGLGVYTVRRSFPQASGTLKVPGLQAAVEVYRDAAGVPHLYADNPHDLFMAQGYIHAQDRFYQMDFWRHQTAGRLSELYGSSTVGVDGFLRTLGWQRIAEQEYNLLDDETRQVLEAYAAGVNAYLAGRSAADISLEYSLLGLSGLSGYTPEPWTPVHTLAWAKAMAWNLGGNLDEEIMRADLVDVLGQEKTEQYLPAYPEDHPVIVPQASAGQLPLRQLHSQLGEINTLLGAGFEGIGSNNWVIGGGRTESGNAMLANDPHLGLVMPSIWYQVGLHCQALTDDCQFDVAGFSFPGAPGVVIGHNNRIAWGFTNADPDVQDVFMEHINPDNRYQYEYGGEWVDMDVLNETIRLRDGTSVPLEIRYTRHGPIITAPYGKVEFAAQASARAGETLELALRWTALEPTFTLRAIFRLNTAQNFDDFREALRDFAAPAQNIVYADVDGNIGYQMPGYVPIRANGNGLLPAPGWTGQNEWTGYIPFDEMPYAYNPPEGYIVTANNAAVDPSYPFMLSLSWDPGYRAQRIVDMIEAQPKVSMGYMQQMQADNLNLGAQEVLPFLLTLSFDDTRLNAALQQLRGWDFQMHMDSQPAALYMSFFNSLMAATFHDDLPEAYWPSGGARNWVMLRQLLVQPESEWWDNKTTPAVETRDDILRQAWTAGYAALEARLGPAASRWTWGDLHTITFENETLGQSGMAAIEALFNRGPFPASGGTSIVNANSFDLAADDGEADGNAFAVRAGPSLRMIIDMGDLEGAQAIHSTGQSGHAYHPHSNSMIEDWRNVAYQPMLWSREQVEGGSRLVLEP